MKKLLGTTKILFPFTSETFKLQKAENFSEINEQKKLSCSYNFFMFRPKIIDVRN